ncbi:uncharacterized protein J5F26_008387 isoform 3-T4 [Ciconia maguari]
MLLNLTVSLQHLLAVVLNYLEEATVRKMASPVVSITLPPEVSVILIQHSLFCHVLTLLPSFPPLPFLLPCCRPPLSRERRGPLPGLPPPGRTAPRAPARAPPRCGRAREPPQRRYRALPRRGAGCSGALRPFLPGAPAPPFKGPGRGCAAAGACPLRAAYRRRRALSRRPSPPGAAMVSWIISRLVVLIFGTLYPAYSSYKAVKTKNVKEYEIDEYITQARDKSYETMMRVGKRGLNLAANAAVTAAAKGQGVLSEKLRSFSMQDLTLIRDEDTVHMRSREPQLHPSGGSLLETIEDSASCYSSGEESSVAQRSNGTPLETRTDPSDEDAGDKLPKRTQSLKTPKKMTKTELPVRSVKARPKKKAAGSLASGESS